MKSYAYLQGSTVLQIITPPLAEDAIYDLSPEEGGEPILVVAAGEQIPLERCYTPEFVVDCVEVPPGIEVSAGDTYSNGEFGPPAPPPEPAPMSAEQARARRDVLLAEATLRIDPLKDAVELGDATPEEESLYTAWRQYRLALSRIEKQPGFPASVVWPQAPQ